jgi:signal transduction histidine kinase
MGHFFFVFNVLRLAAVLVLIALVARWLGVLQFPIPSGQGLVAYGVLFSLFITLILSLGGMSLRRMVLPLEDLLKAADRVGQGDYSVRVEEKGPREARSLARAFNDMASRLDQLDERRRDLMADVTHELRTPLTVVQGNLEGMLDGVYPADERTLGSLIDEIKIISRLVDDLRTLALAESGAIQLKKEPTDLAMLVLDSVAPFQTQANTKSVTIKLEIMPDLPWVELDPGRMRQVLTNLLANAVRYTPAGGTVSVNYRQLNRQALLEVQDSGTGIPTEELPHVFERFHKSSDSGGMGLGLAIAKHLVEALGGTITAESGPGQGTKMKVELPLDT